MYRMVNLDDFSDALRGEVLKAHRCEGDEGRFLTSGQIVSFVRERFPEEDGETVFDDGGLKEIVNFAVGVLLGGCMSEMAANGDLECAWDEKQNDMVWWLPEEE